MLDKWIQQKVAITGASSFTGGWIANSLSQKGWEVHSLFSRPQSAYQGRELSRFPLLNQTKLHFSISAEDGSMAEWVLNHQPSFWIHHHHYMKDFRTPNYDEEEFRRLCLQPLESLVQALNQVECRGILYSGSYFEPSERAFTTDSPFVRYARSKSQTWQSLCSLTENFRIPLSKVVIPNPVGPFENEDRLIPRMLEAARNKRLFEVRSSATLMDCLPIPALTEEYHNALRLLDEGHSEIYRPSGWIGSAHSFAKKVDSELIQKRLHLPSLFMNSPVATEASLPEGPERPEWNDLWDLYAKYENS